MIRHDSELQMTFRLIRSDGDLSHDKKAICYAAGCACRTGSIALESDDHVPMRYDERQHTLTCRSR